LLHAAQSATSNVLGVFPGHLHRVDVYTPPTKPAIVAEHVPSTKNPFAGRLLRNTYRHPFLVALNYAATLVVAVGLGLVFQNAAVDTSGIQNRWGLWVVRFVWTRGIPNWWCTLQALWALTSFSFACPMQVNIYLAANHGRSSKTVWKRSQ
jgi:hypothetical protein